MTLTKEEEKRLEELEQHFAKWEDPEMKKKMGHLYINMKHEANLRKELEELKKKGK